MVHEKYYVFLPRGIPAIWLAVASDVWPSRRVERVVVYYPQRRLNVCIKISVLPPNVTKINLL